MPIYRRQEDGPWWASISVPGKPRVRESLKTRDKREAEKRYKALEAAAWANNLIQAAPEEKPRKTLQEVFNECLKFHWKVKKVKDMEGIEQRWALVCRFADPQMPVEAMDVAWAEKFMDTMSTATWTHPKSKNGPAKPYSEASVNRVMALLGVLQRYAHRKGDHPSVLSMPKFSEAMYHKRRPLTREEYAAMREALKNPPNPEWTKFDDLLVALWGTCCRLGEVLGLEWHQVDFEQRGLFWDDTKGGQAVGKAIPDSVVDLLKARKDRGLKQPFADYSNHQFRACWDWLCEQAKITDRDRVVPHSIRHAGVTRLLRGGLSTLAAQAHAGHKTSQTTERYAHLNVEDMREAAKLLE